MHRISASLVSLVIVTFAVGVFAEDRPGEQQGTIQYSTIRAEGETITLIKVIPDPDGREIERAYTIIVPEKTSTGTVYQPHRRTGRVRATVEKFFPLGPEHSFFTLGGEAISKASLRKRLGTTETPVAIIHGSGQVPIAWQQLLSKDAIILRVDYSSIDIDRE